MSQTIDPAEREPKSAESSSITPERKSQLKRAVTLWVGITLSGVVLLTVLTIWHILRRGRLIRERLGPPREVEWPQSEPEHSPSAPDETTNSEPSI